MVLGWEEGGLNAFYQRQTFANDSVVVKTQKMLAHMEAFYLMQCIITSLISLYHVPINVIPR